MVVELVAIPEVPVILTGYVPGTAVLLIVNVTEVVLESTEAKAAVTPAGIPDAAKLTLLARPTGLITAMLIGLL
jgi:hypothetical protein